ncbi:MAG: RnfABCDGE type electron transport complex subunit D [Pseudomonadota bacterium]
MNAFLQFLHARSVGFVSALTGLMLLPVVGVSLFSHGTVLLPLLAVLLVSAVGTEAIFRLLRHQPLTAHAITTALLLAVLLPADMALWQAATMTILGVILADMMFGGRGFGFLNAAILSAVLVLVSFPGTGLAVLTDQHAVAAVPAILLLLFTDLLPWRALGAFALACLVLATGNPDVFVSAAGALLVGAVFCLCDPFASAQTRIGQILQGLLAASLFVSLGGPEAPATETMIRAVLLTALFVPLIDQLVQMIGRRANV